MDTLTHAISGAVLGRASTGIDGSSLTAGRRMAVGFLAAAFPDIDFALRLFVDPLTFLNLHRGVTHSLVLLPLWALLLAWIFAFSFRDTSLRRYYPLAAMALAIHIAADVITAYGTMILAPFSDYKAAFPTTFIIDPWITSILLAGLIGSRLRRSSRVPSLLALAALAGYVGFQGYLFHAATGLGRDYAREHRLEAIRVAAMPQPLSPFNWRIIIEEEERYHSAAVNLRRREPLPPPEPDQHFIHRLRAGYRPPHELRWEVYPRFGSPEQRPLAMAAWLSPAMTDYRRFAEFPRLLAIEAINGDLCAWFFDLRFMTGDPAFMRRAPFRFGVCRGTDDESWHLYRYGDPPVLISRENERASPEHSSSSILPSGSSGS